MRSWHTLRAPRQARVRVRAALFKSHSHSRSHLASSAHARTVDTRSPRTARAHALFKASCAPARPRIRCSRWFSVPAGSAYYRSHCYSTLILTHSPTHVHAYVHARSMRTCTWHIIYIKLTYAGKPASTPHTLTHTQAHSRTLTHTHAHSRTLTHTRTHTHAHTRTHVRTHAST